VPWAMLERVVEARIAIDQIVLVLKAADDGQLSHSKSPYTLRTRTRAIEAGKMPRGFANPVLKLAIEWRPPSITP
jgi:hypothetical protein